MSSVLLPVVDCNVRILRDCHRLLIGNFEGASWEDFCSDINEKERVALILAGQGGLDGGRIVGFSTMVTFVIPSKDGTRRCVFSGDTTIEHHYRRSTELGKCLGRYFVDMIERHDESDLWYVLISKGWRTYRAMEFMFRDFYPTPLSSTIEEQALRDVADLFGHYRYPEQYEPKRGVIRAKKGAQRLRDTSPDVIIPEENEYARYFATRNPDYLDGDELVCTARVSHANFTDRFKRVMRSNPRERLDEYV